MNGNQANDRMLMGIIGGAVLILLVMLTSIFIVTRRPVVVVVPSAVDGTSSATSVMSPSPAAGDSATTAAPPLPTISIAKVASAPTTDDPLDPFWDKIAAIEVALAPQQVAPPMLTSGTVANLSVQAVRDGQRYIWRLSWEQPEISAGSDVGEFSDAVAMQFPLSDGAPYTMGGPDMPVRMLYWKATWQQDVDQGFQDWAKTHPNADADLYWFTQGGPPYTMDKSFEEPKSKQWMIAASAGNPMANFSRKSPIEELTAHGFGSLTHLNSTPSSGRGKWDNGKWYVVLDRPIGSADPLVARFTENPERQLVAFAVWDGTAGNRGARKNITNWLPMRIEP